MADDFFERAGRKFKRAIEEHARRLRAEMERAREQMQATMDRARADMERERADFEDLMKEVRRQAHGSRDWSRPEAWAPPKRRRRPPRRPRGGEPAPVKPRPNPTPLTDGAEAPIE